MNAIFIGCRRGIFGKEIAIRTGRPKTALVVAYKDSEKLATFVRSSSSPAALVTRARIAAGSA